MAAVEKVSSMLQAESVLKVKNVARKSTGKAAVSMVNGARMALNGNHVTAAAAASINGQSKHLTDRLAAGFDLDTPTKVTKLTGDNTGETLNNGRLSPGNVSNASLKTVDETDTDSQCGDDIASSVANVLQLLSKNISDDSEAPALHNNSDSITQNKCDKKVTNDNSVSKDENSPSTDEPATTEQAVPDKTFLSSKTEKKDDTKFAEKPKTTPCSNAVSASADNTQEEANSTLQQKDKLDSKGHESDGFELTVQYPEVKKYTNGSLNEAEIKTSVENGDYEDEADENLELLLEGDAATSDDEDALLRSDGEEETSAERVTSVQSSDKDETKKEKSTPDRENEKVVDMEITVPSQDKDITFLSEEKQNKIPPEDKEPLAENDTQDASEKKEEIPVLLEKADGNTVLDGRETVTILSEVDAVPSEEKQVPAPSENEETSLEKKEETSLPSEETTVLSDDEGPVTLELSMETDSSGQGHGNDKTGQSLHSPVTILEDDDADNNVNSNNSGNGQVSPSRDKISVIDKESGSIGLELELEIPSGDEDEQPRAAKRAASPVTDNDGDSQPAAKSRRISSSDFNPTATSTIDYDDIIPSENGTITLSLKTMEALIERKVTSFLQKHKKIQLLNKIQELQAAVETWRQEAKSLQRQLQEVSIQRGSLRSAAARGAIRHMAVQCDASKFQAVALQKQQQQQLQNAQQSKVVTVPASTGGLVSLGTGGVLRPVTTSGPASTVTIIQAPPGAIMTGNQVQVLNAAAKSATVRTLLDQQRRVQLVTASATSQVRLPATQAQQAMVKGFIDLTDETEDKSVKTLQQGTVLLTTAPGSTTSNPVVLRAPGTLLVTQPTASLVVRPSVSTMVRGTLATQPIRAGQVIVRPASTTPTMATTIRSVPPLLTTSTQAKHPAPLPVIPLQKEPAGVTKLAPPKPSLKISRVQQGIVLSWTMSLSEEYSEISNYQLFAYQEQPGPISYTLWKKVGDVRALPLPMACTLTQFQEGNRYHFAVRAVDIHGRIGPFSQPNTIHLMANTE